MSDCFSVYMIVQDAMEIIACKFVDYEQTFPNALSFFLFVAQFAFLDFDVVFSRQPTQGFRIVHLFMFHDEVYGVTSFAACKALAEPFGRRNIERRSLVVMERA